MEVLRYIRQAIPFHKADFVCVILERLDYELGQYSHIQRKDHKYLPMDFCHW